MDLKKKIFEKIQSTKKRIYYKAEELFYSLDLLNESDLKKLPENLEFKLGTMSDIDVLKKEYPQISKTKLKKFDDRMNSGQEGLLLLLIDGKIGTYGWYNLKEAALAVGIKLPLEKHQIFFYDFQTFPIARAKGLYKVIATKSNEFAVGIGKTEAITTHMKSNFIAKKIQKRLGYVHKKTYINYKIFGKNHIKKIIAK